MFTRGTAVVRRLTLICVAALATAALVLLGGCNMIKGIGQDITGAAESTEQAFSDWSEPNNTPSYRR